MFVGKSKGTVIALTERGINCCPKLVDNPHKPCIIINMLAVIGGLIMAVFFLIVLVLVFGIAIAIGDFFLSLLDKGSK